MTKNQVIIVDDKEENRYFLSALLQGHGYEVIAAAHGAEALIKARQSPPDLIISDLLMPVMDGYTLLRHWKADEKLKGIPFIVYTATYTDAKDEQLARDLGADDFILKPTEPEPFVARIAETMAKAKQGALHPVHAPSDEKALLVKEYSEVLIRKLEEKALQLEDANRALQQDIAERKLRERELDAISIVSTALRTATSRAEMMPIILDQLLALLPADGAALSMRDPVHGGMTVETARGTFAPGLRAHLDSEEGIPAKVIASGQPFAAADIGAESAVGLPNVFRTVRAIACIPLMIQSENIGLLWVGRQNPITPAEMRLMDSIGEIAANAIQRETSHEQLVQQVQRLSALRMIDAAISNSFDLRLTLDVILDQAALQLKADAVAVLLLNHSTLLLEYAAGRGFRDRAIEHVRVRLGEGLAGRAAFEQRTLSIHNLAADADLSRIPLFQREGFCLHHVTPLIAKGQTKGVLEVFQRSEQDPTPDWLTFFETLAAQTAIAIDNIHLFDGLQRSNIELSLAYDATIEGWSRALDMRDRETEGHTQRVAEFTVRLARAQGMREEEIVHIHRGSLLHDIGKMAIPDSILLKPKPLTDEEWVLMRKHPQFAYDMLYPIEYLRPALEIPYCHHEKMDGSGYPRGLKGEAIPQSARLFAVVDVWDALRSDRPYRKAWNEEKVLEYIATSTGAHFDPKAVELFFSIIRQGASGKR